MKVKYGNGEMPEINNKAFITDHAYCRRERWVKVWCNGFASNKNNRKAVNVLGASGVLAVTLY